SEAYQLSDLHPQKGLLIRRVRVRVPGAHHEATGRCPVGWEDSRCLASSLSSRPASEHLPDAVSNAYAAPTTSFGKEEEPWSSPQRRRPSTPPCSSTRRNARGAFRTGSPMPSRGSPGRCGSPTC